MLLGFAASHASAAVLMTQDQRVFGDPSTTADALLQKDAGYDVAGYLGARFMRYTVERDATFTFAGADTFVEDARARGFAPYLTLTYRPRWDDAGAATALSIPSPAEFGAWCGESAQHFLGRVVHYSVWNEPNHLEIGPTSPRSLEPELYGDLYRACYDAIKAVDPTAQVYIGELSTKPGACAYLADALPTWIVTRTDGVAIHPYQFTTAPRSALPEACRGIGNLPDWNAELSALTSRLQTPQGGRPSLVVGEFGYCDLDRACGGAGNALDEATRAQWIGDAYDWAEENGVAIFSYYQLMKEVDPSPTKWDSGIVNTDVTGTPSVPALHAAVASR